MKYVVVYFAAYVCLEMEECSLNVNSKNTRIFQSSGKYKSETMLQFCYSLQCIPCIILLNYFLSRRCQTKHVVLFTDVWAICINISPIRKTLKWVSAPVLCAFHFCNFKKIIARLGRTTWSLFPLLYLPHTWKSFMFHGCLFGGEREPKKPLSNWFSALLFTFVWEISLIIYKMLSTCETREKRCTILKRAWQ